MDGFLSLLPLPFGDCQFDTDHPASKGTGDPTMTGEWASELAADTPGDWKRMWGWYTHLNERARYEHDRRTKGAFAGAFPWNESILLSLYDRAFSVSGRPRRSLFGDTKGRSPAPRLGRSGTGLLAPIGSSDRNQR